MVLSFSQMKLGLVFSNFKVEEGGCGGDLRCKEGLFLN